VHEDAGDLQISWNDELEYRASFSTLWWRRRRARLLAGWQPSPASRIIANIGETFLAITLGRSEYFLNFSSVIVELFRIDW